MKKQSRWIGVFFVGLSLVLLQVAAQPAQADMPIASGETRCDAIDETSEQDIWSFEGTAGDRVLIDAEKTSGGLNTEIILIDPDYQNEADTNPGGDLLDHVLQKTGTYRIAVHDHSYYYTGAYCLSLLSVCAGPLTSAVDPDGGPIVSGDTLSGSIASSDMDAFQFYGVAGDRVRIDAEKTSGTLNTRMLLIDPDCEDEATSDDLLDHVLLKTGTYTVIVHDNAYYYTGNYSISFLNVCAGPLTSAVDPDGGPIVSGETLSGSIGPSDMDVFQFYGEVGDRVRIDAEKTSGTLDTRMLLIDPDCEDEATSDDLLDHVLLKTGTYTVIVHDNSYYYTGNYSISLLKLPGAVSSPEDCDGGMIAPGETLNGVIGASDMDAYQFYGVAGDRVMACAVKTSGTLNTEIILIDPDNQDEADTQPGGDCLDHILQKTGLYTMVVQDYALYYPGAYNITLTKFPGTLRPGIYNPDPIHTCCAFIDPTLSWDAVADSAGYDVFFGGDGLEPLVKVGDNVTNPVFPILDVLDTGTVYYWMVVAHTPSGDIRGAVNWFKTAFVADFDGDCDVDGSDLAVFAADFGRTDCAAGAPCEGDFDGDGDVDGSDLGVFATDFGKTDCCP